MAKLAYIEGKQAQAKGVIVASGWKAKNNIARMVFRNSITDPDGKRIALKDGVKFMGNDVLLIVPVKNKKTDRSPDFVGICFPEEQGK